MPYANPQGPPSAATTGSIVMITTKALNVGIYALLHAGANDRAAFQAFIEALVREGFEDYRVLDRSHVNLECMKLSRHMEEKALLGRVERPHSR